nr:hypothetical protein [Desulfobulbaceae bacterium]
MIKLLSSKPLSIWLFAIICLLMAASTFFPDNKPYFDPAIYALLGLITLSLVVCTLSNWRRLSRPVILTHIGCIFTLCGGLISAAGYVATVNIYEGDSATSAFRWDTNKDIDLDFELHVEKIHREFYPAEIKVGIFKNGSRHELIRTKTGETFQVDSLHVTVVDLDPLNRSILLDIKPNNDTPPYRYRTTPDPSSQPLSTPLEFKLVAFKTPFLKKCWADLTIVSGGQPVFSSPTSVNNPIKWNGLKFFLTSSDSDSFSTAFAGIQIVKDQGTPLSFLGFSIICAGLLLLLRQKLYPP